MATLSNNSTIKFYDKITATLNGSVGVIWANTVANSYAIVSIYGGGGYSAFTVFLTDAAGNNSSHTSSFIILSTSTRQTVDNFYIPAGKYLKLEYDTPTPGYAKVTGVHFVNTP